MKKMIFLYTPLLSCSLLCFKLEAQELFIRGYIKDHLHQPIPLASVTVKQSYDGATSDSTGFFSFVTKRNSPFWITVGALGYHTDSLLYDPNEAMDTIQMHLRERYTTLNTVSISAGSFVSGVSGKGIALSSIEVATIAGAAADIYGALRTLPGAGVAFGETGLSVRGGSPGETKMFIDGMLVKNPFNAQTPDIAARGRFSVFQFKNIAFSTGGYSAQYGQALSSALSQETQDLPEKTYTRITALTVGTELEQFIRHKNTGLVIFGNYYNLSASNRYLNPQQISWTRDPQQGTFGFQYMQKVSTNDLFKIYVDHSIAKMGIQNYFNTRTNSLEDISLDNRNTYINSTYTGRLSHKWKWQTGLSFQDKKDVIDFAIDDAGRKDQLLQARVLATYLLGDVSTIRFGSEFFYSDQSETLNDSSRNYQDHLMATFLEADVYLNRSLVFRTGLRVEQSQYLKQQNLAPRLMLTYKTGPVSQFAFSYGQYFQHPDDDYLLRQRLNFQKSENFTINYEYMADGYTFRSELYYKNYSHLIKDYGAYLTNGGDGFARGLDIFWRDKKTIKDLEYRISYSFLDTQRDFQDFPHHATPTFASKHTFNLLYRQYFKKTNTQLFSTYTFASGRTYYNPNSAAFLSDRSPHYHNFSLGANYFTNLMRQFTVLFLNVDNILGIRQIFGYRFDQQQRYTISPPARRSILIGAVLSIGDRTFRQN